MASIADLQAVDDTFHVLVETRLDALKPTCALSGTTCPVRFFNKQKQFKEVPVYPQIVIQPMIPQETEGIRAISDTRIEPSPEDGDGEVWYTESGVTYYEFSYQVSAFTDRWDHARAMHLVCADWMFPKLFGMRYLTFEGYTRTVNIMERTSTPVLKDGIFQDVFLYTVTIPLHDQTPEPSTSISGITMGVEIAD